MANRSTGTVQDPPRLASVASPAIIAAALSRRKDWLGRTDTNSSLIEPDIDRRSSPKSEPCLHYVPRYEIMQTITAENLSGDQVVNLPHQAPRRDDRGHIGALIIGELLEKTTHGGSE